MKAHKFSIISITTYFKYTITCNIKYKTINPNQMQDIFYYITVYLFSWRKNKA